MYRFRPNEYARVQFNLIAQEYTGENITYLLMDALGEENHHRYVIVEDSLFDRDEAKVPFFKEGEIRVLTNPDETDTKKLEYRSIGQIQRLG
jgi:hypothetical protein